MIYITDEKEIDFNEGKVVLYFYSDWMPFNKKMLNMLAKMEEEHTNIRHLAINVDHLKLSIKRFDLESIPTVLLFNNGKEIKRITGVILTSAMRRAYADI